MPPPIFVGVTVQASVSFDASSQAYTHSFTLSNPSTNTLQIQSIDVDLSTYAGDVPVSESGPTGWFLHSTGQWGSSGDEMPLAPGVTGGDFAFTAALPPSVRTMTVRPWVDPYLDALYDAGEDNDGADTLAIRQRYVLSLTTLGPVASSPGSFSHWDEWSNDLTQAGQLGWISDATLLATIQAKVADGRQAVLNRDIATAKTDLQAIMDAMQQAAPSQRTSEGYALAYFNAQYLFNYLSGNGPPPPLEPRLTLSPATATHAVGETHTATATYINVASGQPISGTTIIFQVASGPDAGLTQNGTTDAQGMATMTYTGTALGVDVLGAYPKPVIYDSPQPKPLGASATPAPQRQKAVGAVTAPAPAKGRARGASAMSDLPPDAAQSTITWQGGPDLAVTLFSPPLLKSSPGQSFFVDEATSNLGNLPAPATVTRYYISTTKPVDPTTATVFGERAVPALAAGAGSEVDRVQFTIPASLPPGAYYLVACADANNSVIETDETNNCSSSILFGQIGLVPAELHNRPPDCSQAQAVPNLLWPPNHKLVSVAITGVTDPDGDPVTITVTGITQDEPTNGLGDGDQSPDGFGVGTSQAQVRAERSGTGNGRVYAISFTAHDGKGGTCTGVVKVGVPHNQGSTPIDDGQSYDSTKP